MQWVVPQLVVSQGLNSEGISGPSGFACMTLSAHWQDIHGAEVAAPLNEDKWHVESLGGEKASWHFQAAETPIRTVRVLCGAN